MGLKLTDCVDISVCTCYVRAAVQHSKGMDDGEYRSVGVMINALSASHIDVKQLRNHSKRDNDI